MKSLAKWLLITFLLIGSILIVWSIVGPPKALKEVDEIQNLLTSSSEVKEALPDGFSISKEFEYEVQTTQKRFQTKVLDHSGKEIGRLIYLVDNSKGEQIYFIDFGNSSKMTTIK